MELSSQPNNSVLSAAQQNLRVQKAITLMGIVLLVIKLVAWYLTNSISILTDALESIVNVVAGFIGIYSLRLSAQPKDTNHPYGHGKIEFLSAAIEGSLIGVAGMMIIYHAILHVLNPHEIKELDWGIVLVSATAVLNYTAGWYCIKTGKQNQSEALIASGKHLQTDTYSTLGIVLGLFAILLLKIWWLDSAVALVFALLILYTSYQIIRSSVAGIMDEADEKLVAELVDLLQNNRNENWVDVHNLRIIKYGGTLHIDGHLTVPWYFNVHEAHREIDTVQAIIRKHFGDRIELFLHNDGCLPFSCSICAKSHCPERKAPFEQEIQWNLSNSTSNEKHRLPH